MQSNTKHSKFAIHQFGDVLIYQANGEIEMPGKFIPHGYVNVSQLCLVKKKRLSDYLSNKLTLSYFQELVKVETATQSGAAIIQPDNHSTCSDAKEYGIKSGLLIETKDVSGGNVAVFVHPEVAIDVASWISPKMKVWANKTIRAVTNGDFKALTPDAAKAQAELQKVWDELRSVTKETFWFVTDSIKQYYLNKPKVEKYPGQNYSEYFDCLNMGLFGKKAKTIADELGISKGGLNRDHFGRNSLKRIEMIQRISESQIKTGVNPLEACQKALAIMSYGVIDFKN